MTINKSQGQSLNVCSVNLENPCFSHGQFYVTCSYVVKALVVCAPGNHTKNIAYQNALQRGYNLTQFTKVLNFVNSCYDYDIKNT